jgi:hypothetical protein
MPQLGSKFGGFPILAKQTEEKQKKSYKMRMEIRAARATLKTVLGS